MAIRLSIILENSEYKGIERSARSRKMSVAEWVRERLIAASRGESPGDPGEKLKVIRAAAKHGFPAGDIDAMLAEIERGYRHAKHS